MRFPASILLGLVAALSAACQCGRVNSNAQPVSIGFGNNANACAQPAGTSVCAAPRASARNNANACAQPVSASNNANACGTPVYAGPSCAGEPAGVTFAPVGVCAPVGIAPVGVCAAPAAAPQATHCGPLPANAIPGEVWCCAFVQPPAAAPVQVCTCPESCYEEPIPGVYEKRARQVMSAPSRQEWVRITCPNMPDAECWEFATIPAVIGIVEDIVCVSPASSRKVTVPAKYEMRASAPPPGYWEWRRNPDCKVPAVPQTSPCTPSGFGPATTPPGQDIPQEMPKEPAPEPVVTLPDGPVSLPVNTGCSTTTCSVTFPEPEPATGPWPTFIGMR